MTEQQKIWRQPADRMRLEKGAVHVWRCQLNQTGATVQQMFEDLSPEEKQKSDKFRFDTDRHKFIAARSILRKILGAYFGIRPSQVSFSYNDFGKPALALATKHDYRFSVSHSGAILLIAVTRGREVGIDVELISVQNAFMEIARKVFSRREIAILETMPSGLQTDAFFTIWTRKEAYLKALGKGFSDTSKYFTVSLFPDVSEVLSVADECRKNRRWTVMTLPLSSEYKAAAAVEGTVGKLFFWQMSEHGNAETRKN